MSIFYNRKQGLVSVVISSYNYQHYILDALSGLKKQTYPGIEVILIDDCSVDNTEGVVKGWIAENADSFTNFLYLKLPRNCYSSWALNIGFFIARGEFIVIHDADDISFPGKIEKQVEWLRIHPETTAVGTNFLALENGIEYKPFWLSFDRQEIEENYRKNKKHWNYGPYRCRKNHNN